MSASRFAITIDGCQVGQFAGLRASLQPEGQPRQLQAHELAHVVQQRASLRRVKWPPIVLERGVMARSALQRLQLQGIGAGLAVRSLDAHGAHGVSVALPRAKVVRISPQAAKGGGDVVIEELVISLEG